MKNAVNAIKTGVRAGMRHIAAGLHTMSGGRLTPNHVTYFGFLMHIPIAYLIATNHLVFAAIGLIIFGLFDTLDGELARLTGKASDAGGLLDAATDRLKEVLLYSGTAYLFVFKNVPAIFIAMTVTACGASICVSFVKSKGETIVASQGGKKRSYAELNHLFGGGLFPFEIRMLTLAVGLFAGLTMLKRAVVIIAIFSTITVFQRLARIMRSVS